MYKMGKRARLSAEDRSDMNERIVKLRATSPFISQQALVALVKKANDEPLPKVTDRKCLRLARDKYVMKMTPYGPLHQTISGDGGRVFEIQHPFSMLYHVTKESHAVSRLVASLPACSVASPLSIVFDIDEINPGNQLAYRHSRKAFGLYLGIL